LTDSAITQIAAGVLSKNRPRTARASAPMICAARRTNSSKNAHPYSASIASNCSMSM